ncbi:MAG TPA: adenylate/guanylate cyclase domain-containing protein, partial [Anaerolineales bacterium]
MEIYPSGTVTFLFTYIEGSTSLARADPDHWEALRQQHHAILLSAIETHHGYVFQIIGDAFCAAFSKASDALQAASAAQTGLHANHWGIASIKVRMGIHTGSAEVQVSGEYNGYVTLSRVQRIMSAGHGGQTLLSQATQELVRDELPENLSLRDLGEHRLKDLIHPEHIYQLNIPGLPDEFPPIQTLDSYRHNLPVQLTSFIGREKEMAEIKQALAEHHLVTLTGPGGAGKTRLSLQVAAELIDGFADGVWFVDLAPLTDPAFVPHAMASALNLREEGAAPLMDLLANYLQRRELLIVLDNCEHLVEASARAADLLLHASPQLKIIATSREGLGLAGEKTFPVPSLSFSSIRHPSPAALSQYEATRLFIDRALLVQPHFSVNNENAPAVAQICYRLDGIPLAIELAAARVKAMSPEQIATRLDDSFRLLTGGSRTALIRQQTLRAMIDWSWELLSDNERRLLQRLSVFAGGWTLEAAETVCAGEG